MTHVHVAASAIIDAPAQTLYAHLADYHKGHPTFLPAAYFRDLVVEQGGQGAGTIFHFRAGMGNNMRTMRMIVEEPEPGHVLLERDLAPQATLVTRFTCSPHGERRTDLAITTDWEAPAGLRGLVERAIMPALYRRIYRAELRQIAQVVTQQRARATTG